MLDLAPTEPSASIIVADFRTHLARLAADVDTIRRDAGFRRTLDALARFWRYSVCNQWLIRRARPDATRFASRRVWASFGRSVKVNVEPIRILAPASATGFPFLLVDVFDIQQTRGRRVPTLDLVLRGRTGQVTALERAAAALNIRVRRLDDQRLIAGRSLGGEIQIRDGLPQMERVSVIAHELAHELLHQRTNRLRRTHAEVETEAEAVSYVVLRAPGLPWKAPAYIAWQGGTGAAIARSLGRIQRAARLIWEASRSPVRSSHRSSVRTRCRSSARVSASSVGA